MDSENTPETDEEELVLTLRDCDRPEGYWEKYFDNLYGPDVEYCILFNADGSISEPPPLEPWEYLPE